MPTLVSPLQMAVRRSNPAARIALAAVLILSVACTSRQESADYHYMSPDDEQAVVFMSDDEQRKTAVVALKDIMVGVNGFGNTDSYANDSSELPAATSWAIPGTGPVSAAAGDAPIDEPSEDIIAVVTPKPVTASTRHQPASSLSIAPGSSHPESQVQLVSAMNVIASMATGASTPTGISSFQQTVTVPTKLANRPAPTPTTGAIQPAVTPTTTPGTSMPHDTNNELALALEVLLNGAPVSTPTAMPGPTAVANLHRSEKSGGASYETSKAASKSKRFTTDESAENPAPTATPSAVPTVEPVSQPSPEPTTPGKDQEKDKEDR